MVSVRRKQAETKALFRVPNGSHGFLYLRIPYLNVKVKVWQGTEIVKFSGGHCVAVPTIAGGDCRMGIF
jgi:hypothetical protein